MKCGRLCSPDLNPFVTRQAKPGDAKAAVDAETEVVDDELHSQSILDKLSTFAERTEDPRTGKLLKELITQSHGAGIRKFRFSRTRKVIFLTTQFRDSSDDLDSAALRLEQVCHSPP